MSGAMRILRGGKTRPAPSLIVRRKVHEVPSASLTSRVTGIDGRASSWNVAP